MVIYHDCRNAASIPTIRDLDKIESMGSLESRQVNAVTLYNTNTKLNVHGFIKNPHRSSNRRSKNKGNRQSPSKWLLRRDMQYTLRFNIVLVVVTQNYRRSRENFSGRPPNDGRPPRPPPPALRLSFSRRNAFSCLRSYALFQDAGSSSQSTSPCGHLTSLRHNSSLEHAYWRSRMT